MSGGPHRWLDEEGELSALERRVLQSAERIAAPNHSKQRIWSALAAQLPSPPIHSSGHATPGHSGVGGTPAASAGNGLGAASAAAGSKPVVALSALKALAVGFALGGVSVGTVTWLLPSESGTHSASEPLSVPSQRTALRAPAVSTAIALPPSPLTVPTPSAEARPHRPPRPETGSAALPSSADNTAQVEPGAARAAFPDAVQASPPAAASESPPPVTGLDRARLESQRVAEARGLLRAGNPRAALGLLESVAAQFPNGVLVQEREALTIDALLSCGEREAARQRALDFLRRYPGSPHTLSAQRALE